MPAPLLEIRNLSVEFRTSLGPLKAVDGVDLTVDTGEVVGIVGESGSGKSVAMLAVMGLLPWSAKITADRLAFQGEPLLQLSAAPAPPSGRQGHGDDLPGADELLEPLLHRRVPAHRGAPVSTRA